MREALSSTPPPDVTSERQLATMLEVFIRATTGLSHARRSGVPARIEGAELILEGATAAATILLERVKSEGITPIPVGGRPPAMTAQE